jgi:hypothetical protein
MKMKFRLLVIIVPITGFLSTPILCAQSSLSDNSILQRPFDLAGKRTQEPQYFFMETRLIQYALNGTRTGATIYRLCLKFVPAKNAGADGGDYVCARFTVQQDNDPEKEIPALAGWTYAFNAGGLDEKKQVFGIDHSKFENLMDSDGKPLPIENSYHVYNTFIDFHSFCNVFAEPTPQGNGIQDLKRIGQKIVHAAAFSEPPVNLGSQVAEGSFFKNGQITLELKGLSAVGGKPCALVAYDSGESSFKMIMQPTPEMKIQTAGSSHYFGDIYKDLATNWVQKATMTETVVSETALPMPPYKVNAVIERQSVIQNVSAEEFCMGSN